MKIFLVALLISSCGMQNGDSVESIKGYCIVNGPDVRYVVERKFDLNCKVLARNVNLAREMMASKLKISKPSTAKILDHTDIVIKSNPYLEETDNGYIIGWHVSDGSDKNAIILSRSGGALLHEMLHEWSSLNGVNSNDHKGWDKNGYNEASDSFSAEAVNLWLNAGNTGSYDWESTITE